jgi:hypothetical protein
VAVIRVSYAPVYHSPALPKFKDYRIHAASLTAPYFQAIFGSAKLSWKLSPPIHIMSNVTTDYFDVYEEWLRHGKIVTLSSLRNRGHQSLASTLGRSIGLLKQKCEKPLTSEQARENYQNLLGCYSLGTTLNDTPFLDAIASKLVHILRQPNTHQSQLIRLCTSESVQAVMDHYTTESPLYKLLVSAYARFASANDVQVLAFGNFPGHFKSSVMAGLALLRCKQHFDGAEAGDFAVGECAFHGHGFYEECSTRKRH